MDARITEYGNMAVTLPSGGEVIIDTDQRGRLTVRAQDGTLGVSPISSNWIAVTVDQTWGHGPDPRLEAAKDRVQEFLRQREMVRNLDPDEVVGINADPNALTAVILVDDLKLLAGES